MGFTDKRIRHCAETGEGYKFSDDLMLYPITVSDCDLFYVCSPSLTLRMSMLPVVYATKSYAEAIFAMAFDEELQGTEYGLAYAKFMHLLALSMRVSVDSFENPVVDAKDYTKLKALIVRQTSDELGENIVRLDPRQLGQIRAIIAEMNGRELPDESENSEIIQADVDIKANGSNDLKADMSDLRASVAAYYKIRLKELNDWTVYELEKARSAIERMTRCTICGIGEAGGMVKYEKGNPFPSLFFDREPESAALISMSDFQRRMGGAVTSVDSLPDMPM